MLRHPQMFFRLRAVPLHVVVVRRAPDFHLMNSFLHLIVHRFPDQITFQLRPISALCLFVPPVAGVPANETVSRTQCGRRWCNLPSDPK